MGCLHPKHPHSQPESPSKEVANNPDYDNTGPYSDHWNPDNVKMPFADENSRKWTIIQQELQSIESVKRLEKAIMSYNETYQWNHEVLRACLKQLPNKDAFFRTTLPGMVNLALKLPTICSQPIPLLKRKTKRSVELSQEQIASLLANAFFCTFPRRNAPHSKLDYPSYPSINFNTLFQNDGRHNNVKMQKLKCLLHYFETVTANMPSGKVTFNRKVCQKFQDWKHSKQQFTCLCVSSEGTIEDMGQDMLQVDFANKRVGGGVLGSGCVQEEILFVICPELLVSRLFTEELDDNETIEVTGFKRFSDYTGYSDTFEWKCKHTDQCRDPEKPLQIVMMDAVRFKSPVKQFQKEYVQRELIKAYCAFSPANKSNSNQELRPIATGKWGCGVFGGDPQLKALIQFMAAAETGREMYYFAPGDNAMCSRLTEMHKYLQNNKSCVRDLWRLIIEYEQVRRKSKSCGDLFSWVTNNGKRSAKLPVANSNRTHTADHYLRSGQAERTDYNIPAPDYESLSPSHQKDHPYLND